MSVAIDIPTPSDTAVSRGSRLRMYAGAWASFAYNRFIGKWPSRWLRKYYLRHYLAAMGSKTSVQMDVRFLNGRKVFLGENNVINFGCLFDGRRYEIRIGDNVSIGPEATVLTLGHDPHSPDFRDAGGPVVIGNHAWIAYRAIILPGVTIGEGAVVAAGAVVSRDVPPFSIVAGSPAKVIGSRKTIPKYRLNCDPPLL